MADPSTPGEVLAEIAQAHPDLAAQVAAHPNAYPDLIDWLHRYYPDAFAPVSDHTVRAAPTARIADRATPSTSATSPEPTSAPAADPQSRRTNGVLLTVLVALAVGGFSFGAFALWSSTRDDAESPQAQSQTDPEAGSGEADSTAIPPAEVEPTSPTEPTAVAEPSAPAEVAPTTQAAPSPVSSESAPPELSDASCGPDAELAALAETARFEVAICRDASTDRVYYSGESKESGNSIRLEAYLGEGPADALGTVNFYADNGEITYRLTDRYLIVYDGEDLVMQEAVTSWQAWF